MLKSFLNRLGLVTASDAQALAEKAAQEKYPDWYLAHAAANQYDVPEPSMYQAQAELMTKVSYLYTVVTLTAQSAASQDFDIENGDQEISNHPLEKLLKAPNPMQTGFEFLRDHFTYKLLNGSSYWWLNCTAPDAKPAEIWLIPPGNIAPVPDEKLGIREYAYSPGDGSTVPIPTWQILWFRGFHPSNMYASLSGLVPLAQTMKTDIETQRFLGTVYGKNSGRLPGIIAFKSPVADTDWKQIKRDIAKSAEDRNYLLLRGVGDGVNWLQAAATLSEMETLNGRKMTQEDIYNTFAPGLMNMTSVNATEANAVTGKKTYAEFTLYPMLTDTQQKINKELSPRYGNIKLEFDDPRGDDKNLQMAETEQYAQFHSIDEVRVNRFKNKPLGDLRGSLLVNQISPVQLTAPVSETAVQPDAPVDDPATVDGGPSEIPQAENELAAELMKWQRFEENHWGKKSGRFDTRKIPPALAARINAALLGCKSSADVAIVFAQAGVEIPVIVLARQIERLALHAA